MKGSNEGILTLIQGSPNVAIILAVLPPSLVRLVCLRQRSSDACVLEGRCFHSSIEEPGTKS